MGHLLAALLARGGRALPFAPELLRASSAPKLMLRNWNLLAPVLEGHGVPLSADAKALIIAGGAFALPRVIRYP